MILRHKHIRQVFSLMMVFMLMMPSLVKIDHHHEEFVCNAQDEKHLHEHHDECAICHFEFSLFNKPDDVLLSAKEIALCQPAFGHYESFVSSSSSFTFYLRGPPAKTAEYHPFI